jgi:hypothetical protein
MTVIKHLILRSSPVRESVEDPDQPGIGVSDPHTRPSYPDPDPDTLEHRFFLILCGLKWVFLRSVLWIRIGFNRNLIQLFTSMRIRILVRLCRPKKFNFKYKIYVGNNRNMLLNISTVPLHKKAGNRVYLLILFNILASGSGSPFPIQILTQESQIHVDLDSQHWLK